MLSYIVFSSLALGIQANFLQDIGQFFSPADISDKAIAKLGLELFNLQWKEHGDKFKADFPVSNAVSKLANQLTTPLQYASFVVCPECQTYVADVQETLKNNEDLPRWLVEILVPLSVCPAFYALDADLVPICMVAGFGGSVYLTHSDPATVCQLLPFCGGRGKRSAVSDEEYHNRNITTSEKNESHVRELKSSSLVGQHDILKRVTDIVNIALKDKKQA